MCNFAHWYLPTQHWQLCTHTSACVYTCNWFMGYCWLYSTQQTLILRSTQSWLPYLECQPGWSDSFWARCGWCVECGPGLNWQLICVSLCQDGWVPCGPRWQLAKGRILNISHSDIERKPTKCYGFRLFYTFSVTVCQNISRQKNMKIYIGFVVHFAVYIHLLIFWVFISNKYPLNNNFSLDLYLQNASQTRNVYALCNN